ncbi:MAG: hypothetical protein PHH11_12670 [Methylomonas sp.]|nr:hypothetical protein [Methylomonas sp.]
MNKKILTIALALALPLSVAAYPGGKHGDDADGYHAQRIERLTKELDLTADQQTQLEQIFKDQAEKREALRQETHQRMQTVLTPEQVTKFEEMKKNRHETWQKRHHIGKGQPRVDQMQE